MSPTNAYSPTYLLMLALLLVAAIVQSPADELRAVQADLVQIPPAARSTARYLTLYAIDPAQRPAAIETIGYVLNALSRTRAISQPQLVSPTLLRFNLSQYTTNSDEFAAWSGAWEKLAQSDPYFHLQTEVLANKKGTRADGGGARSPERQTTDKISSLAPHPSILTVTTDGGWLDLSTAAQLRSATGSIGALLRADYFVSQATVPPRYYEFAGIPDTEDAFLKSLGVNRETIQRLQADAGANLIISGVTDKPRRIVWSQGPLGGVYSTLDVERVDAQRDPLRRPITAAGLALHYDVSEWFALAPNGLWRTALFNAAGKRQDSVPDRVAKDTSDPQSDGIVVPMISCIRCHREAGLRPFVDDQTRLLAGHVNLYSDDPSIVQRAAEFYDQPRLQRQIQFDRQTYTDAVARCTSGKKPEQLADSLAAVVRNFAYRPVTPEQAAREIGLTPTEFQQCLSASQDPVILLLLEGRSVLRGQWEASFPEAALAATTLPRSHEER